VVLFLLQSVNREVAYIGPFSARKKSNTVSSVGYSALAFLDTNARPLLSSALGVLTSGLTLFLLLQLEK